MRESCLVYCYSGIQSLLEVVLLYTFYTALKPKLKAIAVNYWSSPNIHNSKYHFAVLAVVYKNSCRNL